MNDQIRLAAKKAMAKQGITQQDIAEKAGIRQPTVSRLLTGERGKAHAITAMLDVLGLELVAIPKGSKSKALEEE